MSSRARSHARACARDPGTRARAARFVAPKPGVSPSLRQWFEQIGVAPDRAVVVDVVPEGVVAARDAGCRLTVAIARSSATPAQLRQGGATAIVADLQELLGPITGR